MPQLNPNPWFTIFLLTWTNPFLLIQPKLLSFTPTNSPSNKTPMIKTTPWIWPWT
uniref:ATP synthase complex subunit 8 n=1 Tax=Pipile jacutinga TaxID=125073 RepID=Q69I49_PIPJA|nr:ATP synthase F0 subunit 8 [Pipile jacutinga]